MDESLPVLDPAPLLNLTDHTGDTATSTDHVRFRQQSCRMRGAASLPSRPPGRESAHVTTVTRAESLPSPGDVPDRPVSHSAEDNDAVCRQFHLNPAVLAG